MVGRLFRETSDVDQNIHVRSMMEFPAPHSSDIRVWFYVMDVSTYAGRRKFHHGGHIYRSKRDRLSPEKSVGRLR